LSRDRIEDMINVTLFGAMGRMGHVVAETIASTDDIVLKGAVEAPGHPAIGSEIFGTTVTDNPEIALADTTVAVDFTNPSSAFEHLKLCREKGTGIIIGTTALSEETINFAKEASNEIPVLISPNMSVGVNLLFRIVKEATVVLKDFDIEITEIHHRRKKDSPSGTANQIALIIKEVREGARIVHGRSGMVGPRTDDEIGMHSIRGGDVVGEHTVIFAGEGERFEITHRAHSRKTFAMGTLKAIRFLAGKGKGFYSMADVLFDRS